MFVLWKDNICHSLRKCVHKQKGYFYISFTYFVHRIEVKVYSVILYNFISVSYIK